ncbi:MAG: ABC transporter ATP-binding protein [Deltaproteobacteria bacterium]|nr:ABC transporter ATP-binding protein [Deltaproteobacteria bacterium]
MTHAIETTALRRKFWRKEAVKGVDLAVPSGSIYAFLGPNGAGKTTTIKMLMNLLRPSSGEAHILGTPSHRLRARHFESIGYVSENQELPEWMTVERFLKYLKPFYPTWDDDFCAQLLDRFQLPLDRKLKHLSRGMKVKASLVSSLVYHPQLLVLDEPFTGLDPLVRDQLVEGVLELVDQGDWTVFISSHDLQEVENIASHVGFLSDGQLLLSESQEELKGRFQEIEVVLEEPQLWPVDAPASWHRAQVSGEDRAQRVFRFTATNPKELEDNHLLRSLFPGLVDSSQSSMSLRSIFVTLAENPRIGLPSQAPEGHR